MLNTKVILKSIMNADGALHRELKAGVVSRTSFEGRHGILNSAVLFILTNEIFISVVST